MFNLVRTRGQRTEAITHSEYMQIIQGAKAIHFDTCACIEYIKCSKFKTVLVQMIGEW